MCRQRAGCNPGAAKADGQRPWWKPPRSVLGVLRVWRLANGRLECPNERGLCAGKGQAAMLERWRPGAWWKLPRGMCRQRAGCNPGAAKADGQELGGSKGWRPEALVEVAAEKSSTPAVVPGAAPALAKAGVGGYVYHGNIVDLND